MPNGQAFEGRIQYSEKLLRDLEGGLGTVLGGSQKRLKLSRREQRLPTFYCGVEFRDEDSNRRYVQPDGSETEWVVSKAIRRGASSASVWLGIRLRFDAGGEGAYLTSASILVLALRSALYPLVRAEWDYRGLSDGPHGQPHWHVLTALQAETRSDMDPGNPVEFGANIGAQHFLKAQESIHLAMCANWPMAKGSQHVFTFTADGCLRNWVLRAAEYSINQVQYALNRMPGNPPAVDFLPLVQAT